MSYRLFTLFLLAGGLLLGGCIPYTVGTTARPVPKDELVRHTSLYTIPNGLEELSDDLEGHAGYIGMDLEMRLGLSDREDVGLRAPGATGLVVTYKRLLTPPSAAAAVAAMGGLGVVNVGEHAHFEASVLVSGAEPASVVPYGGARVMQVLPIVDGAVRDSPTAGVFFGLRLGTADLGISPELGVFYDRSALNLRDQSVIVVPAVTLYSTGFLSRLPVPRLPPPRGR